MSSTVLGRIDWGVTRNEDGHRDYFVKWLVEADSTAAGPQTISFAPGLPQIGAQWAFGLDNDAWAFCSPAWTIAPFTNTQERSDLWVVTQPFTTRPLFRCQTQQIENPLLEPPRLSGSYVREVRRARVDRHGEIPRSISSEPVTGQDMDVPESRPTVHVEITQLNHNLDVITSMTNTLNDAPLWGLSPRKVFFSDVSWRRFMYGTCTFYFVMGLDFEINFRTFDRTIGDVSRLRLAKHIFLAAKNAGLTPDDIDPTTIVGSIAWSNTKEPRWEGPPVKIKDNPRNYEEAQDEKGGQLGYVHLDDWGMQMYPGSPRPPGKIKLELLPESNFLLLGIPVAF